MENELNLLRKLQSFDLEIEAIENESDLQKAALEEQETLYKKLSEDLEAKREQLDETRTFMNQKKIELQENSDDSHSHKDKQARVSSARELSAIEKEIESLKRRRAQLEEEYEALRDAVTDAEEDVQDKQEKVEILAKELKAQQGIVEKESKSTQSRIDKLEKERTQLKDGAKIANAAIARYEFIRKRLPGHVIVEARDGACTGCNMVIPPQLYNELQEGERVIQCPNCKRILYYENAQENEG